jgi:hypothetical protein
MKSDMFGALIGAKSLLVEQPEINIKAFSYKAGMEAVNKVREESRGSDRKEEGEK